MQENKELLILSPFEIPDTKLVLESIKAGAFPVLHLGRDKDEAIRALDFLSKKTSKAFGVCFVPETSPSLKLPANVTKAFVPFGLDVAVSKDVEIYCQVHSLKETEGALKKGYRSIIVKGNDGAGKVGYKSSFVLFQGVVKQCAKKKGVNVYIQGGAGVHTSAAALALGAKGVILDSQIALFPETSVPQELKDVCRKLSGSETSVIDEYRVLLRKNSPTLPATPTYKDILPFLGGYDLSENIVPMGQDITLSVDLVERYKKLKDLIAAIQEAAYGHLLQSKSLYTIRPENDLALDLGIKYPIAQGPMARVSDIPQFAQKVSEAGALPFVAMSMMRGKSANDLVQETGKLLEGKTWGVGILGFIQQELRDEQTKYILEARPPVVLIAGGRPSIAKPFEKQGIKTFLHVPSAALLDMFIKEGSRNFIFEGRESGGHVGPLSSFILWEKQIYRLLKDESPSTLRVFFAGGIHDNFSSAFVSIMSATLAAKGTKIGILMGTSYIYTKEAVESGAILEDYQKKSIEQNETVLLEAAPGQETRSLKSPFTEFFTEEKKRLQKTNMDSKEIWIHLEDLNIGRLRIAAKGVERQDDKIINLNKKEQFEKGLYMIGQTATLHKDVITMSDLHKDATEGGGKIIEKLENIAQPESNSKPLDIAIVGMACIYPNAKNIEEYWRNILLGENCVTEVPDSRWNKELFYDPNTRDTDFASSKWGGFIPTIDFDPLEFGIPPQSLASIEPTQLLSLYVAKRALDDAGYANLEELDKDEISVIFGAEGATELASSYGFRAYAKQVFGELPDNIKNALPRLNEDSFAGVLSNVISGRIANRLNFGGRNYTVDAACASSLAALDLGCQELSSNRSDMVVLGGADLHNGLNDFLMFSCTHALSRKGYCASFDADSDGIALGEGVAVLILKRLEDAERDGNKIYSVIKGVGGSSDGKSLGMTAPNRKGQVKALQRAYQAAGILPSQVGLVEAHGTGTVVGDKTELSALTDMFLDSGALVGQTHLGSVKTQIGHAKCAAGIAGVVKSALSIYYGIKPPTIHLNKPNNFYNEKTSPFVFNIQSGLWNSEKRIAGVSAFGFGGTNFHVILENYQKPVSFTSTLNTWPSELYVFRGDRLEEAKQSLQRVKQLIQLNNNIALKDVAYSLANYNKKDIQISIVASNAEDLLNKVEAALVDKTHANVYVRNRQEGKVAFMFSGQGSQRINMARDLFVAFPSMRRLLQENKEYENIIFPNAAFDESIRKQQQTTITDTRNAQPLLGIVDWAIADFLRSLGIEPDMVAGHSYGELPALCFAGAFAPEALVNLSRERALAILNAVGKDSGKMAAVSLPEEELKVLLEGEKEVWAVNFNSHKQIVLAGSTPGMTEFMKKMDQKNIAYRELNVACAFHSPLLNKSKGLYGKVLADIKFGKPKLPIWSNTTAQLYPTKDSEIKTRLTDHLIQPVLFSKQLENMYADGARVFIETGPGKVLIGLAQSVLGNDVTAIQTEGKGNEAIGFILNAIAKYISTGRTINFDKLFEGRQTTSLNLDEVDQYKKKPTVWHINGHYAEPSVGKMPAHGAYPIEQPLFSLLEGGLGMSSGVGNLSTQGAPEHVMVEYLEGMRAMIQNQRDVMLGYLGQGNMISQRVEVQSTTGANTSQQAQNKTQTPQAGIATANVPATQSVQVSAEEIKVMLLDVVSEKTGYPVDMLGLDLDLEADLSIDSIKRMEIIGDLKDRLHITGGIEESDDAIERMASIKTLNGLIGWIEELVEANNAEAAGIIKTAAIAAPIETSKQSSILGDISLIDEIEAIEIEEDDEEELARMSFVLEKYPCQNINFKAIKGKKIAITDDGIGQAAHAKDIKKLLETKGAKVDIITNEDSLATYDGLVVLNITESPVHYTIRDVFCLIKSADMNRLKWVFTFSDLLGSIDVKGTITDIKEVQGFPGLIKSLGREYPDANYRAIVSHSIFNRRTLPQIVLDELCTSDPYLEVIYDKDERYCYNVKQVEIPTSGEPKLQFDKDSVIVVLGGAQGITAELVSQMSSEYPCNYVLVGRSATLEGDEAGKYALLNTQTEIRQFLIKEEKMSVPAEIEEKVQKIFKGNQIQKVLDRIKGTGSNVTYTSLDVTDSSKLKTFIRDTYAKHGKIDGFIHAAGLLEDKLFSQKSLDSFVKVYSTKVKPLHVLLDELRPDIKLFVMFSSIASAYGNCGQTDYAAANSVFDLAAWALSKKTKGRVLTINWGPWKGAGMVSSALEGEFNKRGVSMIPLVKGGNYFVNELKYGIDNQVLVMGGSKDVQNFLKG